MPAMTVRVDINEGKLREFLRGSGQPTDVFFTQFMNRVANTAKTRANVDTGRMRASIVVESDSAAGIWQVSARTEYAMYVHEGRGPIVGNPLLVFTPKGSNTVVFARRVGPYAGNPFLRDALAAEVARL